MDKIKVNAIHGISTYSGGQTALFRNIRGVGITHVDRRDGPAKQCLNMAETQTAFNTIRSEAFLKEMDRYLFLPDRNNNKVSFWSLPWLANLSVSRQGRLQCFFPELCKYGNLPAKQGFFINEVEIKFQLERASFLTL